MLGGVFNMYILGIVSLVFGFCLSFMICNRFVFLVCYDCYFKCSIWIIYLFIEWLERGLGVDGVRSVGFVVGFLYSEVLLCC